MKLSFFRSILRSRQSRRRNAVLQALFEQSFELKGLLDPSGRLIKANERARELIASDKSDIVGKPFWETPWWTHSPEQQGRIREAIRVAQEGKAVHFEANFLDRQGHTVYADFSITPVRNNAGGIICLIATGRDITHRKNAEWALKASEERLRTIIDAEPECVKVIGSRGELLEMNPAGLNMLEIQSFETVKGLSLLHYIDPDYREQFIALHRKVMAGESDTLEFKTIPINGKQKWFQTHALPLKNSAGNIYAALGITRDISSQKLAQEITRDREELLRQIARIAQTAPGGLAAFRQNPDGSSCFPYVSPTWEEYYGLRQRDVEKDATPAFQKMHRDDVAHVQESIAESARTMTPWRAEFRVQNPKRGEVWLEGHSTPTKEPDGAIIWHGFVSEITARKKAAAELIAAKETAEAAAKAQAKFLDIAAHELRTPVTSLNLLLELAQKKFEKGEPVDPMTVQRLRTPAQRLATLVKDLLDLSRLERGLLVLQPLQTDLAAAVAEFVEEFRMHAPKRVFRFTPPSAPVEAVFDRIRIHQVISNFLDNAVKYTPEGTPIEIQVSCRTNGNARVAVIDYGPGIPAEQQKTLFGAFSRGTSAKVAGASGLGLGLSIARRIIELHGGSVGLESPPGQGSSFYFELPCVQQENLRKAV